MNPRVVTFHYELLNDKGETLDSSRAGEPFTIMEGGMQIIPGLEAELLKMKSGEKKRVRVPVAEAYGAVDDKLKMKVERARLPQGDLKVGMQFDSGKRTGSKIFTVTAIEGDQVSLDGNHPLAGHDLTFDVEVTVFREATEKEMDHGHAHGSDGHKSHSH